MLITLIRLLHIWPQIQSNLSAHLDQTIPHSVFQLFILFFASWCWTWIHMIVPRPFLAGGSAQKPPWPPKSSHPSIPSFIHCPHLPPDTAPCVLLVLIRQLDEAAWKCFVTVFLVKCAQPGIIGGKDTSSISREPAICLGELSRCLISFIISPRSSGQSPRRSPQCPTALRPLTALSSSSDALPLCPLIATRLWPRPKSYMKPCKV